MTDEEVLAPPLPAESDENIPLALRAHEHERRWYLANYPFLTCETVLTHNINPNDARAALLVSDGNLAAAAALLGLARSRLKAYIDKTPDLSQFLFAIRESILDVVENNLYRQALNGDASQIRFLLSTLGKDRGFTTKTESDTTVRGDASLEGLLARVAQAGKPLVDKIEYTDVTEEPESIDDPVEPGPVFGSEVEDLEPLPDN